MADRVEDWVRPEIRELAAYAVPDASGFIKLDAMENPYTWPEPLKDAWTAEIRDIAVNRYPDPRASDLVEALRSAFAVPNEAAVLLGNGSDELIQMLALTLAGPGRTVLSFDPGFVMYRLIALFTGLSYAGVALREGDFALDLDAALAAIERERPALTYIAYPNNPTGNLFERDAIIAIIEASPGLVIVDEAYAPFTDSSFMGEVMRWPNLLVMRTLSKMGLAGLRLGLLVGPPAWIEQIDKTRLPYNINVLTQASVRLALAHRAIFDEQTRAIRAERLRLQESLAALDGPMVYPSEANFILVRCGEGQGAGVFDALKAHGILVKKLDGAHPMLADCIRVTVGRPDENDAFMAAMSEIVGSIGR